MSNPNLLLLTDSYKVTHWKQYPKGTTNVYSYFESRLGSKFSYTTFFGLQYFLKKYLTQPITRENIEEADEFFAAHLGTNTLFNRAGWEHILREHGGRLPVSIRAVPEGMAVPISNVLMTIENTDPKCYWLTNYLETLLVQTWYPTTVATNSREARRTIDEFAVLTGGNPALVPFKLHDFGFRGVSSVESAGIGGLAHLINFLGTDTMAALVCGRDYYHEPMAGFSIPAAEHSTITAWGGPDQEVQAFRNMITQFGEGAPGLYATVSDSFDIYRACSELWGKELREAVLAASNTLVVRPDSGYPPQVVVAVLRRLGEAFGTYENKAGFKNLNDKVRVIQGDGVDLETIHDVLENMKNDGWSTDNIAFGMGGALLQKLNRDTQRFAFKCSSIIRDGKEQEVYKDPATDHTKVSKAGRLSLIYKPTAHGTVVPHTVRTNTINPQADLLAEVFRNGELLMDCSLAEVRERAKIGPAEERAHIERLERRYYEYGANL